MEPELLKKLSFENNVIALLFKEIRYELDGVEVARTRRGGITSTTKICFRLISMKKMN